MYNNKANDVLQVFMTANTICRFIVYK